MYEQLGKGRHTYVLHLPQGRDVPYALEMWTAELHRMIGYLEEHFGTEITREKLVAACEKRNAL